MILLEDMQLDEPEIPIISPEEVERAKKEVVARLAKRIEEKGRKGFASEHEAYGKLSEELLEFQMGIWKRGSEEDKISELEDIAVGAIWAIASYHAGMRQKKKKDK